MPASNKRYKVILEPSEREFLTWLASKGKGAVYKQIRARILLKADESAKGPAWTDQKISDALDIGCQIVERTREALVEESLEAALNRKKRSRPGNQKFDGEKEAHLIAIACSKAPDGRERWTLQMLADRMVELNHFKSISHETIRQTLKKTNLNLG